MPQEMQISINGTTRHVSVDMARSLPSVLRDELDRVPRFRDQPRLETELIDRPDIPSPGAGETPIIGIAPAIRNAIAGAAGVRLHALPMIPHGLQAG
ncbi:MAG TPA: hypothetical protein VGA56_04510 [Opitutaceae bacterium]